MSENVTWVMEDKKGACISLFFMGGNKKRLICPDAAAVQPRPGCYPAWTMVWKIITFVLFSVRVL